MATNPRKSLFRKVEKTIEAIERSPDVGSTIAQTANAIVENFREDMGVRGGRLYERRDGGYEVTRTFGAVSSAPIGLFVSDQYPPVQRVVDDGVVVMDLTAPVVDPELEKRLDADLMASLGILRHAVDQKLRQERFVSALNEARQIQMSILPRRAPRAGPFDMSGFTAPAEIVGGDFFDFIEVSERIWGVAIADASGHGLPAALQVRDVYTGLRMGVARDFKIVRTVERLNRIIHQSRMTTKFVSLFYGEIEEAGNFIYVNAGHPFPLHFHAKGTTPLKQTGMVLGPSATASYSRGFLSLERGDALLLYTDGMTEATDPKGREFGEERLKKAFLALSDKPSDEIVRALVAKVGEYVRVGTPEDDRTVVVVKRSRSDRQTEPVSGEAPPANPPSRL